MDKDIQTVLLWAVLGRCCPAALTYDDVGQAATRKIPYLTLPYLTVRYPCNPRVGIRQLKPRPCGAFTLALAHCYCFCLGIKYSKVPL